MKQQPSSTTMLDIPLLELHRERSTTPTKEDKNRRRYSCIAGGGSTSAFRPLHQPLHNNDEKPTSSSWSTINHNPVTRQQLQTRPHAKTYHKVHKKTSLHPTPASAFSTVSPPRSSNDHCHHQHEEPVTGTAPPPPPGKKTKKQVRFGTVQQCVYKERSPTKSERKALWYSAKEIRAVRTEICALNLSVSSPPNSTNHNYNYNDKGKLLVQAFEAIDTWRGLEHVRQGALMNKLEHRQEFVRAFLYFAIDLGVSDPNALAVFSATNSKPDRQRAVQLGTQDALDACKIYYVFLTSDPQAPEVIAAQFDRYQQQHSSSRRGHVDNNKNGGSSSPSTAPSSSNWKNSTPNSVTTKRNSLFRRTGKTSSFSFRSSPTTTVEKRLFHRTSSLRPPQVGRNVTV